MTPRFVYEFDTTFGTSTIGMHVAAKILDAMSIPVNGTIHVRVLYVSPPVDPDHMATRQIMVCGAGTELEAGKWRHVKSVIGDGKPHDIWHMFERTY